MKIQIKSFCLFILILSVMSCAREEKVLIAKERVQKPVPVFPRTNTLEKEKTQSGHIPSGSTKETNETRRNTPQPKKEIQIHPRSSDSQPKNKIINTDILRKANILIKAYPNHLSSFENGYIVWRDGTRHLFDDGLSKTFEQYLNNSDLEDQFHYRYPKGQVATAPRISYDPGRFRNQQFFKKMYGHTSKMIRNKLVTIRWMPKTFDIPVTITSVNGIDQKLSAISQELDNLPPKYKKYLKKLGGTFNWRVIAGTNRLSPHSFGAAIDINVKYSAYWKWDKNYKYKNQIPLEIVKIFEKHGFIWGGRWYHYDTMHFEYRPELLMY